MKTQTQFRAKKYAALEVMKDALESLSLTDAIDVTGALLVDLATSKPAPELQLKVSSDAAVMQSRIRRSNIESDPEVEAFLLSLKGYMSLADMRQACIEKFGAKRAPSRSALQRYISKLKYRRKGAGHAN